MAIAPKENPVIRMSVAAMTLLLAVGAQAQTTVSDAWVRGTVAGQKTSGMFARITSAQGGKLVAAASPLAGVVEIHEMAMDGNVMKMRAVPAVDLPAGKAVELKQPLKAGEQVPLTLTVEGADGKRQSIELSAPVKALAQDHSKH